MQDVVALHGCLQLCGPSFALVRTRRISWTTASGIGEDRWADDCFPLLPNIVMTEEALPLGGILRSAREAAGWSLSRMGRVTGFSKPYLSKLETGEKEVRAWHIEAYDKALGGDSVRRRALLVMGAGMVSRTLWAELDTPSTPPSRLVAPDLAALEASADMLTGLGLQHGGRASAPAARGQLRYAVSLLHLDMPERLRARLLAAVARLADRAAWSMADSGQAKRAEKIYDFALTVSPDPVQRWLSLVNLANLRLEEDQPCRALDLLEQTEPDLPVLRFLTHSAQAHAHARIGDFGRTLRHIETADSAHAAVDLEDLPPAVRPYASGHQAHAHSAAGRALHVLAQAGRPRAAPLAAERLEAAVDAFGPERARAIASCRRRLAALP
ncbi:helix-turn-helix domain-containing protein [Micromonospora sp. 4G55]|uniref:helix-turn-helix domain-containing protein n=1 Tax=Micromonospora sp. 4G55 TaxID=2806102 RepID=UPI001A457401|nr:helix-turn-helix transcriptional regulator [Micromonospora sp. 4G55]MBM0257997.1 helix-turn-helix transcriptional regulator [Micromonospora sp. 4G55]MBM0259095.1 helix-turn-helix transcriptional regulator [Micromonospora sp. 4G55]